MNSQSVRATSFGARIRSAVAVAVLATAGGCADSCAREARGHYLREQAEVVTFQAPDAQLWAETRALLAENGFDLPPGPAPRGSTAVSTWRDSGSIATRVLVRFDGTLLARTRVVIRRQERTPRLDGDGGTALHDATLDQDLTWQLFERAEPNRAAAVREEADRHERNTYAVWRGCERVVSNIPTRPAARTAPPTSP